MGLSITQVGTGLPVHVVVKLFRNQARCRCGWEGNPRVLQASAVVDAWQHCEEIAHSGDDNSPDIHDGGLSDLGGDSRHAHLRDIH